MSKKAEPKKEQGPTTTAASKDTKNNSAKIEPPKNEKPQPSKDLKVPTKTDVSKDSKVPEPKIPKDNVLLTSGLMEAYEYLQKSICKHGFPKGNVFEYAAVQVMKFEKKFKAQKAAKYAERLQEVRVSISKSKSPERGASDHPGLHEDKKDKKDPKSETKKDTKRDESPAKKDTKRDESPAKKEEGKKEEPKKDAKKDGKKEEPKKETKKEESAKKEEPKKETKKEEPKKETKKEEPAKKDEPKKEEKGKKGK